ncbi:MAG: alpha/beta fold hydrolase [Deltaproteobacteria bacterium]|nr:alpha/beta fold hydrolase [Deltaproteobacteria bacterium]
MATVVAMPKLGMTMREGSVVEWPLAVGDAVEKGHTVVLIESEKTQVELEATDSGVLRHIYVEAGETVPCGSLLGAITASIDEPFDAQAFRRDNERIIDDTPATPAAPSARSGAPRGTGASSHAAPPRGEAAPVTPAARALARSLGIDAARVAGTGPGGRVTKEDIEAFASRRERLVEVSPGLSLEVLRQGAGAPVVLLPGFGVGVASFAPQIQALTAAGGFEVIGLHPRGIGASDAPDQQIYEVAAGAEDAAALAATLGGPVHLVGASLGSAVALELALRFPARVRSLTLITPFVDATPRLRAVADGWRAIARHAGTDTLSRALLPWLFSQRVLGDDKLRERMQRGLSAALSVAPADALDRWAAGIAAWSGSRSANLTDVSVPTLVIAAGADLLTPRGEALGSAIAGASLCVLDSVGHAAATEAAEAVCEALLAHLRAH